MNDTWLDDVLSGINAVGAGIKTYQGEPITAAASSNAAAPTQPAPVGFSFSSNTALWIIGGVAVLGLILVLKK